MKDLETLLNQEIIITGDYGTRIFYKKNTIDFGDWGIALKIDLISEGLTLADRPYCGKTTSIIDIEFNNISTNKPFIINNDDCIVFYRKTVKLPYTSLYYLEFSLINQINIEFDFVDVYYPPATRIENFQANIIRIYFNTSVEASWAKQQIASYL